MKSPRVLPQFFCSLLMLPFLSIHGQVVINEIFYHAPDDLADLQWIEFYNTTDHPVDLTGWRLAKPVKFNFASGTIIAPNGYAVICKDRRLFQEFYSVPIVGQFEKTLKHGGERLELRNSAGQLIDSVEYGNRLPWPRTADGGTASLERICPTSSGKDPENWAGSPLSADAATPGGTPGEKNVNFCATIPPTISQVSFPSNCIAPGRPVQVDARVESKAELKQVELRYRVVRAGVAQEEKSVPMLQKAAGAAYSASIPGQQSGQVVRLRIHATDQNLAERYYPSANDARPAFSCLVFTNVSPGKISFGYLIHPDAGDAQNAIRQLQSVGRGTQFSPEAQARTMAEMQFRAATDLSTLWAALTLTNGTPTDLEKLRAIFGKYSQQRDSLEQKTLATANFDDLPSRIPALLEPLKTGLEESIKPLLTSEQIKIYDSWSKAGPEPGGGPARREDPAGMLREFIPLEPHYMHLALTTNVTSAQLVSIRELYRDAIQERDSLIPDLRKLMSGPREGNQAEGERLQTKAESIPASAERKLKQLLTPAQSRQFAAWQMSNQPSFMHHTRTKTPEPVFGESAFVLVDPKVPEPQLFDFVRIPERSGGWKVHFAKDRSWNGTSVIDLIFEASDRWLLAEPLAYDLHRRAGAAACRTDFIRLTVDDHPAGYYLLIEQPNKAFLRRNNLRDDGNLYKANWAGNGLEGQNEKHTNRRSGHGDLVKLVDELEKTKNQPDEQWAIIRREFDVEQVLTHYAVRMLIADWDGFFNNYFLYHDVGGTKKWTFYPWDEDKTWGEYDGWEQEGLLYNLPLTYGAEGDHPPGEPGGRPSTSYGFRQWWRAGGYISRPVLANPTFRKYFQARVKELLDTEFTEAQLFPLVDGFRDKLQEEIQYRAKVTNEDPARAEKRFEANLASLKEFITRRRQWLLEQAEIKNASPLDRASLK